MTATWTDLFERSAEYDVSLEDVRAAGADGDAHSNTDAGADDG